MDYSEKWGSDIEEAVSLALKDLKLSRDEVEVTVLEQPSRGFFGMGKKLAKVRVEKKKPEVVEVQKPEIKPEPEKKPEKKPIHILGVISGISGMRSRANHNIRNWLLRATIAKRLHKPKSQKRLLKNRKGPKR